jgi:hypothetical protein
MESVLKQKNIVKLVLNDLSKHGTIPGDGFLCGQNTEQFRVMVSFVVGQ